MIGRIPELGILLLETSFPRIPGDVGNSRSYPFPVRMKTVPGATVQRVVFEADPSLRESFISAARELAAEGVAAITSSCGFLSLIQEEVAKAVDIPVFLSSLMQVPLSYSMTHKPVGIITANSESLTTQVLESAGITTDIPISVTGLEGVKAFREAILNNGDSLNKTELQHEITMLAEKMLKNDPKIGSFLFECHNLAPYAYEVSQSTGKPVFDIISFASWVYSNIDKNAFAA